MAVKGMQDVNKHSAEDESRGNLTSACPSGPSATVIGSFSNLSHPAFTQRKLQLNVMNITLAELGQNIAYMYALGLR